MRQRSLLARLFVLSIGASLLVAACSAGRAETTPTTNVEQIQTQAVASFAADLTSTALALPTATPTATETPVPTTASTSAVTNAPAAAATSAGIVPTSSCYGLVYVSDVTIPDNTTMTPGQKFTKTWRVRNSGSCAWATGFMFKFRGGEEMRGSTATLESEVQSGEEADVSVELTAPNAAGTYRGNWRMSTASGTYFGDEVYVLIVVGSPTPSATSKASATTTLTPTESPAPTDAPTQTTPP